MGDRKATIQFFIFCRLKLGARSNDSKPDSSRLLLSERIRLTEYLQVGGYDLGLSGFFSLEETNLSFILNPGFVQITHRSSVFLGCDQPPDLGSQYYYYEGTLVF